MFPGLNTGSAAFLVCNLSGVLQLLFMVTSLYLAELLKDYTLHMYTCTRTGTESKIYGQTWPVNKYQE